MPVIFRDLAPEAAGKQAPDHFRDLEIAGEQALKDAGESAPIDRGVWMPGVGDWAPSFLLFFVTKWSGTERVLAE